MPQSWVIQVEVEHPSQSEHLTETQTSSWNVINTWVGWLYIWHTMVLLASNETWKRRKGWCGYHHDRYYLLILFMMTLLIDLYNIVYLHNCTQDVFSSNRQYAILSMQMYKLGRATITTIILRIYLMQCINCNTN
jgi:hypothetical protein